MEVVNLREKLSLFSEHYQPRIVGVVNNFHVKLVKLKGEFIWHHHDAEDELFLVIAGELGMMIRRADGTEEDRTIRPGEFIIIPHGTEHKPYSHQEAHILLLEPASTLNTGNVQNERTVAVLDRI